MPANQRSCPGVGDEALGDPRGMAKLRREALCCIPDGIRRNLEELFLDRMAYLDPKGDGDSSMPEKRRSRPDVRNDVPRDPCDMAKAGLPEAQSPEDANNHPPERRPKPAPVLHRHPFAAGATSRMWSDPQ